jgi:hypothetical protein
MLLADLIVDPQAKIYDIASLLDGLDPVSRWDQVCRLDRDHQRTLYRKAEGSGVALDHFVSDAPALTEVIHDGLNTLPVPGSLRRFSKRFSRPDSGDLSRVFGYNEGLTRRVLGPGYFVAVSTGDAVVVDYYQVPDGPVPPGWPPVVPNSKGLQRFVYHETRDVMRGVSAHVSVGAAHRRDKPMDHYFVLCRRP